MYLLLYFLEITLIHQPTDRIHWEMAAVLTSVECAFVAISQVAMQQAKRFFLVHFSVDMTAEEQVLNILLKVHEHRFFIFQSLVFAHKNKVFPEGNFDFLKEN